MRPPFRFTALLLLALAACRQEKVSFYQVPKEKDPELPAAEPSSGSMAGTVPGASGPSLTWSAPSSWKEKALGAARKGSYTVTDSEGEGDLSITAFPGDVGGEAANLNRWRGQLGLPALSPAELERSVTRMDSNGLSFAVVDIATPGRAERILGAIIPFQGSTWFIKLKGPDALLDHDKQAFTEFLKTVRPQ